ncbi:MAG: addiction module toxin RelE [Flammeovirgaceae bacterium]|nr:addiction module toxin RelE [Flammeovirgaceae bacterium]|tara:strand:- start:156 stop:458 length:303 start_codon:yes stop_codon:yes gene_type:complete
MRIIAEGTLKKYYQTHPEVETGLKTWLQIVKKANWSSPEEILNAFSKARPIGNGRVIFNINKNDYRLIVQVNYDRQSVYICFIGTHSEYDKIDPLTVWDF